MKTMMGETLISLSLFAVFLHRSNAGPVCNKYLPYLELDAVDRFREYVRIDTSQDENLKYAVEFWIRQATKLGMPYAVYEPAGKPIFVATLEGTNPSLPSIMLNSHMDVVTADEREWVHPPFAAHMDEHGDIYGRGTQDTKDVTIQYIEAIRRLKKDNVTLARTLHVTVMSDEEQGGKNGIKAFLNTKEFKALNIGFALDEGLSSIDDTLFATFVDRRPWQMQFVIYGDGGHSYTMPDGSAMEKAHKFINNVMAYRDTQKQIMKTKPVFDYAEYTSVNINMMNREISLHLRISPVKDMLFALVQYCDMYYILGGLAPNIVPSEITLVVDMRLSTEVDAQEIQSLVDSWIQQAGNNTKVTYIRHETESRKTAIDDSNPYWVTMKNTLNKMGIKITPVVCPATSDMLVLRNLGIPALGFSAKTNTSPKLHGKNEYLNVETFIKGIDIYTELIKNLANVP